MAADQTVADMNLASAAKSEPKPDVVVEHPDPPVTPLGEIYKAALAKEEGKEAPKKAETTPEKPKVESEPAKKDETPPEAAKPATKPSSALDAVLEGKVEAKKEEPPPADDPLKEFPEEDKKPNWKRAREVMGKQAQELQTLRTEREQLQKERDAAKAETGKVDPEIQKKLDENAELRDAITAVNLELLPEFRKEFGEGRKLLVGEVSDEVKSYGGDADALIEALGIPRGRRRDEAIELALGEDITEVGKSTIRNLIAQIDAKDKAKAKMLADPQNSFEAYQAKVVARTQKQQEEAANLRQSEISNVLKSLPELSPLLRPADPAMPDAKEWNEDLEAIAAAVPKDLGNEATLKNSAVLAAKGRRFDYVEKKLIETYAELKAAKKQLAEYDGAQPEAKGNAGPQKTGVEATLEKTPGQIFKETMARETGNPIDA